MFSLIITIISIALVVALVAATMYYGGSALNQGTVKADASGFVAGAQQIAAALTMNETDGLGSPKALLVASGNGSEDYDYINTLIANNYLATVPVVKAGALNTQDSTADVATTWLLNNAYDAGTDVNGTPKTGTVLQATVANEDVCLKLKKDGGPTADDANSLYSCDNGVFTFFLSRTDTPSGSGS